MASQPIAKISVLANGNVLLDGRPITILALDAALDKLKASSGVVWYYRAGADAPEPPAAASQVIQLIIKHKVPVSMSTKPGLLRYGRTGRAFASTRAIAGSYPSPYSTHSSRSAMTAYETLNRCDLAMVLLDRQVPDRV